MRNVPYQKWAQFIDEAIQHFDFEWNSVLEIASGSGILARELAKKNRNISVLSDLSPYMLQKSQELNSNTPHIAFDMNHICFQDHSFNGILCCFDSIHYLKNLDQVRASLLEMKRVLKPNGWLHLDTLSIQSARGGMFDWGHFSEHGHVDIMREAYFDADDNIQHNNFIFYSKTDLGYFKHKEHHAQFLWENSEFSQLLDQTGWSIIAMTQNFTLEPASTQPERIHWFLQPKKSIFGPTLF